LRMLWPIIGRPGPGLGRCRSRRCFVRSIMPMAMRGRICSIAAGAVAGSCRGPVV